MADKKELDKKVLEALKDYEKYNALKAELEQSPYDYKVRSQITDPNAAQGAPPNDAIGISLDMAQLWADTHQDKASKNAIKEFGTDQYQILEGKLTEGFSTEDKRDYQISLLSGLGARGIKTEVKDKSLQEIIGLYQKSQAIMQSLAQDTGLYMEDVTSLLKSDEITALEKLCLQKKFTGIAGMSKTDTDGIKAIAMARAKMMQEVAVKKYKEMEGKYKEDKKNPDPYKLLQSATEKALVDNKDKGSYLVAYDTLKSAKANYERAKQQKKK